MSVGFGFSLGDIIASYKLAKDIYENCFTRAHAADVKYLQFKQEIHSLGQSLRQLESIITSTDAGGQRPRVKWHTDEQHFGVAFKTLPQVTGDFKQTLNDCERFLRDHARLQHGRANPLVNFGWWTSADGEVNDLRERVKFHITKVAFIAKPFEIQLLMHIRREVRQLREEVKYLTEITVNGVEQTRRSQKFSYRRRIIIPEDLTKKFTAALETNRPPSFDVPLWPVKEGFDALVFHFAKSTVEFNSRPELGQNVPDAPQYLNLLKSVWIVEQLHESPLFQDTGCDSLWADYMRALEDDIINQFDRFERKQLISPPIDVILHLPDGYYSIWVEEGPQRRPLEMAEQRQFEEKILELALPSHLDTRESSLTVFRKSDVEFRLAITITKPDNPLFHSEESFSVNMDSTRLIPAYAFPGNSLSASNNLVLCNDKGQYPEWHFLKESKDVENLQRALTGYRVHHDMSNFSWRINGSEKPGYSGRARLQLWQLKPLPRIPQNDEPSLDARGSVAASHPSSQPGSPDPSSPGSSTFAELVGAQLDSGWASQTRRFPPVKSSSTATGVSRSSIASKVTGPRGEGTQLMRPEVPVLVIFTMCNGRYTFLHIKLEQSIFVNPQRCDCKRAKKRCTRAILESTDEKSFRVQKLSADPENEQSTHLYTWDLGTFRHPQGQKLKNVGIIERVMYLDLNFDTVDGKDTFLQELIELENVRTLEQNDYERNLRDKIKRAHR